jgi:putative transposase
MPRLTAAPIALTPAQAEELQRLARAHKTPRKLAERAEMILRSAAGTGVREIARQLGVWPKTVRHWRARWLALPAEVPVAARLADTARPGAPATFTPEQVCAIMALEPISIGLERERGGGVVDIFPEMEMIDGAALFGRSA